jgi:hypothetical protein
MSLWKALSATYRGSIAFLIACPLLALVPVVFELIQHAVEAHIGMYDSIAAAKATEHHPLRMASGLIKVAALVVPAYWIIRFLAYRDPRAVRTIDTRAIRLFAGVVAFQMAFAVLQLFVLPQTPAVLIGALVIGHLIACLAPAWMIAAALGNADIGPAASIRIMARQLPWSFLFLLCAILPLMIPHYALGAAALLGGKAWLWPLLMLDSLLVGWLCAVMAASSYVAAQRAATSHNIALRPNPAQ